MATSPVKLPPGFELESQPRSGGMNLPPGFELEQSAPAPATEPEQPGLLRRAVGAVADVGIGAMKGAGSTAYGASNLTNMAMRAVLPRAIEPEPFPEEKPTFLRPQGTAQEIGYGAEQLAEFMIPGGAIAKAGTKAATLVPRLARVAPAVVEGLAFGGITAAQTGSPREGATAAPVATGLSAATQAVVPRIAKLTPIVRRGYNALEGRALNFLRGQGVPVSTGQAAGHEAVSRAERGLLNVPGASSTAREFFGGQERALQRAGESVVPVGGGVRPVPALPSRLATESEAGQNLADRLVSRIKQARDFADKRYEQVRSTLGRNKVTANGEVELVSHRRPDGTTWTEWKKAADRVFETPTDISSAQKSLRSVYDELAQTNFPEQASPGFAALKRIVEGPSVVDAVSADRDLGAMKYLLRKEGHAGRYLSTQSQRLAGIAVDALTQDFNTAVSKAGGGALMKLGQGRMAVKRYHELADFVQTLPRNAAKELEPAAVFQKFTQGGDRVAVLLGDLRTFAPNEVKELGRTYLQGLLETATREGGFQKAGTVLNQWNRLGPRTKELLFDKSTIQNIDDFWLGAKRLTQDPNPSGTAKTLLALGGVGLAVDAILRPGTSIEQKAEELAVGIPVLLAANKQLAKVLLRPGGSELLLKTIALDPNSLAFARGRAAINGLISQGANDRGNSPAGNRRGLE